MKLKYPTLRLSSMQPKETNEFEEQLNEIQAHITEEIAVRYLEKVRWGGESPCINCGHDKCHKAGYYHGDGIARLFKCVKCSKKFTVYNDTVFSGNSIGIDSLYLVLTLLDNGMKPTRIGTLLNLMPDTVKNFEMKLKNIDDEGQRSFIKRLTEGATNGDFIQFAKNYEDNLKTSIEPVKQEVEERPMKAKEAKEVFVQAREVAKILGVSYSLIMYWRQTKKHLPFINKEGRIKCRLADVERLKVEREKATNSFDALKRETKKEMVLLQKLPHLVIQACCMILILGGLGICMFKCFEFENRITALESKVTELEAKIAEQNK